MIKLLIITLCIYASVSLQAQYFYKDILSAEQTSLQLKKYKAQNIKSISVVSYESDGERTEDFSGQQVITDNFKKIQTSFNTALSGVSELTTYFNASGQLVKTVDTSDGSGSVSEYRYDDNGRVSVMENISTSPGMHIEKEEHRWFYNNQGKPEKMLRIKNNSDTTHITFVLDEKGNVAEENSRRNDINQASYYYYYDDANRLTDIVTYNQKAKRLLPIYVFEYNANGALTSMLVVPEGTDDYQRWLYEYNTAGLKTRETAYNKRRQVLGKVEYAYR